MLIIFFLATLTATGADAHSERAREALRLADAADSAVPHALPKDRDDLRALRDKLRTMADVDAITAPEEWDASLRSLLNSDTYGVPAVNDMLGEAAADRAKALGADLPQHC